MKKLIFLFALFAVSLSTFGQIYTFGDRVVTLDGKALTPNGYDPIFNMVLLNETGVDVTFTMPTLSNATYTGQIRVNGGAWADFTSYDDSDFIFTLTNNVETLVEITGTFQTLYFANGAMKDYLISGHYGSVDFGAAGLLGAFYNSDNLIKLTGQANIAGSCSSAFESCASVKSVGDLDVGGVTNMSYMFYNTLSFNQDLSSWDVSSVTNMTQIFYKSGMSTENYSKFLVRCAELGAAGTLQSNVPLGAGTIKHNAAGETAITYLTNTWGWIITDGGLE